MVVNGLDPKRLESTAEEIRKATNAKVIAVAADVATKEGQDALFAACPEPDILIGNNAGPPFRDFRELDRQKMIDGVIGNMIVPVELLQKRDRPDGQEEVRPHRQHHLGLGEDAAGRPRPVVRRARRLDRVPRRRGALGRAAQRHHQLHPARPVHDRPAALQQRDPPPRSSAFRSSRSEAQKKAAIPAKRFGDADEFGAACAFLCSTHAGFITGQNVLIDGGIFPGAF